MSGRGLLVRQLAMLMRRRRVLLRFLVLAEIMVMGGLMMMMGGGVVMSGGLMMMLARGMLRLWHALFLPTGRGKRVPVAASIWAFFCSQQPRRAATARWSRTSRR